MRALVALEQDSRMDQGKKITRMLFVEWHRTFRQAASLVFDQRLDLEVVSQAGSVQEGRERLAKGGIDAALVDIPLPDEGAAHLVRELHESNPSIPVLVLADTEDREVAKRFLEAGASEVLPKKTAMEDIISGVKRLGSEG